MNVAKLFFLTNLILTLFNQYNKNYIYLTSLHQDLYQKLVKCFSIYIPIHIIPKFSNEEDLDMVVDERVNYKDFEKSDTESENFEPIDELKLPQEHNSDQSIVFILDDLDQKQKEDPRLQAMLKRSRHNFISTFIISQDYYELGERTIR